MTLTFKKFALILGISYVLLLLIGLGIAAADGADEFNKIGTVVATVLTCMATVATSIFAAYRGYILEGEKVTLAKQTATQAQEFTTQLAGLNNGFVRELKVFEAQYAWKRKAYDELAGAAATLYYQLQDHLLTGGDVKDLREAVAGMAKVRRYLTGCSGKDMQTWIDIQQAGQRIMEKALPLQEPGKKKKLWEAELKKFGSDMKEFEEAAKNVYHTDEPPATTPVP